MLRQLFQFMPNVSSARPHRCTAVRDGSPVYLPTFATADMAAYSLEVYHRLVGGATIWEEHLSEAQRPEVEQAVAATLAGSGNPVVSMYRP